MNVYDEAHGLARALKESNEFKEFDRMRKEVEQDSDVSKMLGELQTLQIQLQTAIAELFAAALPQFLGCPG